VRSKNQQRLMRYMTHGNGATWWFHGLHARWILRSCTTPFIL